MPKELTTEEFLKTLPKQWVDDFEFIRQGKMTLRQSAEKNQKIWNKRTIKATYKFAFDAWNNQKEKELMKNE